MDFWTLSLALEADDEHGLLTPRVRIGGGTPFTSGVVRVGVVDPDGGVCGAVHRSLRPNDIGTELQFLPISLPDGVLIGDVLRGGWDVAVRTDGLDRIRWRRYLEVGTRMGAEAEILLAGPPEDLWTKAEAEGWGPEAPWDARDSDRLLSDLILHGLITEADRKAVLADAASSGMTVERTLVDRGHLSERDMLERYADVTGTELLDLDDYPFDPEAVRRIPEEMACRYGLLAVGYRGELLTVAMSDPQNLDALRRIELINRPYIALATEEDVLRALHKVRPPEGVSALVAGDSGEGVVRAGS